MVRNDFPNTVLFGNDLEKSGAKPSLFILEYSRSTRGYATHCGQSVDECYFGAQERQRDNILGQGSILEHLTEDDFMYFLKRLIASKELASNIRERTRLREIA